MKILSAHQPNFIPWAGFFLKIIESDLFVFSDDCLYSKQQLINRVYFNDRNNQNFLVSLPIDRKFGKRIFEKKFAANKNIIVNKLINRLLDEYKKTEYFSEFKGIIINIQDILLNENYLSNSNISIIKLICNKLDIELNYRLGSEMGLQKYSSNERLLFRSKSLGIMHYLYGKGTSEYQDDKYLIENGMVLKEISYDKLKYFGNNKQFSIMHLIANYGIRKTSSILLYGGE
mgnify:CR=1 FL=1|tara:strand:+ start:519 stop:1211 length:693 start_codon:yes stop_codon:yes gene_type:complete